MAPYMNDSKMYVHTVLLLRSYSVSCLKCSQDRLLCSSGESRVFTGMTIITTFFRWRRSSISSMRHIPCLQLRSVYISWHNYNLSITKNNCYSSKNTACKNVNVLSQMHFSVRRLAVFVMSSFPARNQLKQEQVEKNRR